MVDVTGQINSSKTMMRTKKPKLTGQMMRKTVAVTGAAGFIASHLVKDLLERGYHVRGTVRSPEDVEDMSKVGHLLAMPEAKERLTLHNAALLDVGSFDSVVHGVDGVFHTASPFFFKNVTDPDEELWEPAVRGTINVLLACEKAKSVKRVVLTSSFSSVIHNFDTRTAETVVDETSWTDPLICRMAGAWYPLSKTIAEIVAWEFAEDKHFDLVVMNPATTIGTMLQPTLNTSTEFILDYLSGFNSTVRNLATGFVDVQDVALAHVLAYEAPDAKGRYLLVERVIHHKQFIEILQKLFPEFPILAELRHEPSRHMPTFQVNVEKARMLGVVFKPLESQLEDCVASLIQKGALRKIVPRHD